MNIIDELILKRFSEGVEARKDQGPTSTGMKAAMALSGALLPLALQFAMRRPITPWVIPQMALMGGLGYAIPTMYDQLIQKENPREAAMQAGEQIVGFPELNKTSGFGSAMLTAGKYALRGARDIGKGVFMPVFKKNMPFKERALSVGSKALVGYGAYKGGKSLYENKIRKPDYSNYMRNQVLAGNIQPGELSQDDLASIRKISSLKKEAKIPINAILGGLFTITGGMDAAKAVKTPVFQAAKKLPQTAASWQPY